MRTIAGLAAAAGLGLFAAAGCTSTGADGRLAALESEVRALRAEIAELKARRADKEPAVPAAAPSADPLGDLPGLAVAPETRAKLAAMREVGVDIMDDAIRRDVDGLKEKVEKLEKAVGEK